MIVYALKRDKKKKNKRKEKKRHHHVLLSRVSALKLRILWKYGKWKLHFYVKMSTFLCGCVHKCMYSLKVNCFSKALSLFTFSLYALGSFWVKGKKWETLSIVTKREVGAITQKKKRKGKLVPVHPNPTKASIMICLNEKKKKMNERKSMLPNFKFKMKI